LDLFDFDVGVFPVSRRYADNLLASFFDTRGKHLESSHFVCFFRIPLGLRQIIEGLSCQSNENF